MLNDFLNSLQCVLKDETQDYQAVLEAWQMKDCHTAFMPAITWYSGICNLFAQKAGVEGKDMIWIIPAAQHDYYWLSILKQRIEDFYAKDEMEMPDQGLFLKTSAEEFEECILLHSNDLQNESEHTILGANVVLLRLSLSNGSDTLLFILLDHQDNCWKNIIEEYNVSLTWLVDSGRGMGDYFIHVNLYQLMKNTSRPNILPPLYFKGLYNKGEIPVGFRFLYAMLSEPDADGYDIWQTFSAVYDTGWRKI
ncbi:hypothetical protein [Butyrivibrio sp. AE2032]|uniref:hypothetical protein n=1 Tax=Butyrivibrio sp. AE2032 TaxID=1458463 RepID=UPI0005502361|nr:hypothetical protein [Butyrivibrio sp. AE2032]